MTGPRFGLEESFPQTTRLRLRVTPAAETAIRAGHPWVYADSVRQQNRPGALGELAVVYDKRDRFLAVGHFDPTSVLRVRVLQAGKAATLDSAWWRARLQAAVAQRADQFDGLTTGYRIINGESDGWPGLVLDRYGDTLVMKFYCGAWLMQLQMLTDLFTVCLAPQCLVLRLSRNIVALAQDEYQVSDGQCLIGASPSAPVHFRENGLWFEADVLRGQKTGFFLDQRENRRLVGDVCRGCDVLNAFSFTGGFSLYAARAGARSVVDLDLSAHALAGARRNFLLNGADGAVAGCAHVTVQADTFEWLALTRREFDVVVMDPPSLARREAEREGAVKAYARLAILGLARLRPGGMLVAASCSAHVSGPEFFGAVRSAVQQSQRGFREWRTTAHPPDHPATFAEAHYLKCIYLRVE